MHVGQIHKKQSIIIFFSPVISHNPSMKMIIKAPINFKPKINGSYPKVIAFSFYWMKSSQVAIVFFIEKQNVQLKQEIIIFTRSEERRVGKEWKSRYCPDVANSRI